MTDRESEVKQPLSDFEKLVYEAIGEASMCWSETPKGIFESCKATEIARRIIEATRTERQEG